jgi:hypothetical protein
VTTTGGSPQAANKDKKTHNSRSITSQSATTTNQVDTKEQTLEIQNDEQSDETNSSSDIIHDDDEIKRPESISFTTDINEPFVESSAATPTDESNSYLLSTDPMTTSFVDGAPNTRNPFLEKNDDIEIIHHNISTSTKYPMPSIDEINPQGLPIDDENQSKKAAHKRLSAPAISSNHPRKSRQNQLSGPIFYVDVAYIPYHGNEHYVDSEFFRRIRARYYILNAVEINRLTLESLIDGKQQWEKQEQIPVNSFLLILNYFLFLF